MRKRINNARILIYSHDSFGLGHLRRCRTIANSLVGRFKGLSVLILSGSPIIGSFEFRTRVDFVRIPGVIQLRDGEYSALGLHIDIAEVLRMRASIIRHTAEVFAPDVFIVDKEPLGLRGEIHDTLTSLKSAGCHLVLGLRDIMGNQAELAQEWERKGATTAVATLYDDILIYGLPQICEPLASMSLPPAVNAKIRYTGYLRAAKPRPPRPYPDRNAMQSPYVLVTAGGGHDGAELMNSVIRAYEQHRNLDIRAELVLGPFLAPELRDEFIVRAASLENVRCVTYDTQIERRMAGAAGVVSMGGYNTFCECLTFNKPTLLVRGTASRREQIIRAERAQALGLVRYLSDDGRHQPSLMAAELAALPNRKTRISVPGLLDGLESIHKLTGQWLKRKQRVDEFSANAVERQHTRTAHAKRIA